MAYHAHSKQTLLDELENYTNEMTVLAPSAWDPSIRLEPPKALPVRFNASSSSSSSISHKLYFSPQRLNVQKVVFALNEHGRPQSKISADNKIVA